MYTHMFELVARKKFLSFFLYGSNIRGECNGFNGFNRFNGFNGLPSNTPSPAEVVSNGPLDGLLFERSPESCHTCARNTRGTLQSRVDANPKPANISEMGTIQRN